jgi:hypothetical protein
MKSSAQQQTPKAQGASRVGKPHSRLRAIDSLLIKRLVDLHPWPIQKIAEIVGMSASGFSHVTSGRRPLPIHAALKFFDLLGVTADGGLSSGHCFVFESKPGLGEELKRQLAHMYPSGAEIMKLARRVSSTTKPGWTSYSYEGVLLRNGTYYTVIHNMTDQMLKEVVALAGDWVEPPFLVDQTAGALLSLDRLPTDLDIHAHLSTFETGDNLRVTWDDVKLAAEKWGVDPATVMRLMVHHLDPSLEHWSDSGDVSGEHEG